MKLSLQKSHIRLGIFFALISVVCSSVSVALGEPLFEIITPTSFALLVNVASLITLLLMYGTVPEYRKLKHCTRVQRLSLFLVALLNAVLAPYLFFVGWNLSTPNNTVLLGRAEMLFTVLFAAFFLKERITFHQIVGIIIMLGGIYTITSQGFSFLLHLERGDMLIIFSCIVWAVGNVIYKKFVGHLPLELVLIVRVFFGTIFFGVLLLILGVEQRIFLQTPNWEHLWYFLGYCAFSMLLAKYCFMKSAQLAPLSVWSSVALSAPVIAVLSNYLLLGEIPKDFHYLGGVLIIIGFALLNFPLNKAKITHPVHLHRHNVHV